MENKKNIQIVLLLFFVFVFFNVFGTPWIQILPCLACCHKEYSENLGWEPTPSRESENIDFSCFFQCFWYRSRSKKLCLACCHPGSAVSIVKSRPKNKWKIANNCTLRACRSVFFKPPRGRHVYPKSKRTCRWKGCIIHPSFKGSALLMVKQTHVNKKAYSSGQCRCMTRVVFLPFYQHPYFNIVQG